jgi:REP element-mobilizing transposase RayT
VGSAARILPLPFGMTAPRQVLPGTTYLVSHRCSERRFFLRPTKLSSDVFRYLLAVAAQRHGIRLHAFCVMSNHYHLVLTDPHARLPDFQRFLDGLAGRAINPLLGRRESFWGPDSYSAVELAGPEAILDKATYTLANPVAAGLVRRARRWPGLWSSPDSIGAQGCLVKRPNHFFDPDGTMPASVTLTLSTPPGFSSVDSFREQLTSALSTAEDEAARRVGTFLGVARVLKQRWSARATSPEPLGQLNPRVAGRNKWKRIERLARLASFLADYRVALQDWRAGRHDALFPAGTYLMRLACGVSCAPTG